MSRVTSIENIIHFLLKGHIMQISMKCSIAVHCLIFIHEVKGTAKVTSNLLAKSTGCNPVIIRNIISSLKKAGIITVPRGTGGAELCADPSQITLYQTSYPCSHWCNTKLLSLLFAHNNDCCSTIVDSGSVTSCNQSAFLTRAAT